MNKIDLTFITESIFYKRYKAFVIPVFALFICVVLLVFLVIPSYFQFFKNNQEIKSISEMKNFYLNKLSALKGVNTTDVTEDLNTSLETLPAEKDIPSAITRIFNLISENKLRLDSISFSQATAAAAGSSSYSVNLGITGDVNSIKSFISSVKNIPRLMQVSSVDLTTGTNQSLSQVNIAVLVFYQPLEPAKVTPDSKFEVLTQQDKENLLKIKEAFSKSRINFEIPASEKGKTDPFQ